MYPKWSEKYCDDDKMYDSDCSSMHYMHKMPKMDYDMCCKPKMYKDYDMCEPKMKDHDMSCNMPKMKCEKKCVKTFKCTYKLYKICCYRLQKVCPRCGHEFDYHRHRGMCPRCD
ncbi:MAG: hypothetical protein ACOYD5_03290 [Negativicutes bacterium]|jgi:hypothetical protein